jgi:hypothetical protein
MAEKLARMLCTPIEDLLELEHKKEADAKSASLAGNTAKSPKTHKKAKVSCCE